MVRAPTFPPEEERRGRRNALLHPLERYRILKACERAAAQVRGTSLGRRARRRLHAGADVLLWGDRAFVRPGYFSLHRDSDGTWHAVHMVF